MHRDPPPPRNRSRPIGAGRAARRLALAALVAASGVGLGCGGGARLVTRDATGGLFALDGDEGAAREDAERQMREHCGARGFRVTADGTFTVATREEPELTPGERGRRFADEETRTSSAFAPGMAGSGLGTTTGLRLSADESPEIYDPATSGATPRVPTPVREHRLEYECGRR